MPRRNGIPPGLPAEIEAPLRSRHDLHWLAMRLFRGIAALDQETVRAHGLSVLGYEVLVEIAGRSDRGQADLAAALGLGKTALGEVLGELETAGFVSRRPDPGDRRMRIVHATESGAAAMTAVAAQLQRNEDEMFFGISRADREIFFSVLQKVSAGPLKEPTLYTLRNERLRRPRAG
jgi:DNA-binding MarR family transcriptional regulator